MNSKNMQVVICPQYGSPDVLQLTEVPRPTPKDNEVLVRVRAAAVSTADTMMRKGTPRIARLFVGLRRPKKPIIGTGFAGEIVAVGKDVLKFKVGEEVMGGTGFAFGTYAEFLSIPEEGLLVNKPTNMTFAEAAPLTDGALTAYSFLTHVVQLEKGQKILINGASGSIGTSAVQIAKSIGAEVTGVCSSKNMGMVKALGADHVIDYTQEDFTKRSEQYDVIFDTIGKSSYSRCKRILTEKGAYISPVLDFKLLLQSIWTSVFSAKKAKFSATGARPVTEIRPLLQKLTKPLKEGKIRSIMDRQYTLGQIVEAHQYVETGRKRGNVVVTI